MKVSIFGLLTVLIFGSVNAQSLSPTDTLRVDSLNARAFTFIGNSPDSMIANAEKALDLSNDSATAKGKPSP